MEMLIVVCARALPQVSSAIASAPVKVFAAHVKNVPQAVFVIARDIAPPEGLRGSKKRSDLTLLSVCARACSGATRDDLRLMPA